MAVTFTLFEKVVPSFMDGTIDLATATLKLGLAASSATFTPASNQYYSDVSAQEFATGGGYTRNATANELTSVAVTQTNANSWTQTWATGAWSQGQIIRPNTGNNLLYTCVNPSGGTSTGSEPSWGTTVGETTTDSGGVIWLCIGAFAVVLASSAVTYSAVTLTNIGFAFLYVDTGTAGTSSLISLVTFTGGDIQSPSSENYVVSPLSPEGWFQFTPG
jgi:hypothetical protein